MALVSPPWKSYLLKSLSLPARPLHRHVPALPTFSLPIFFPFCLTTLLLSSGPQYCLHRRGQRDRLLRDRRTLCETRVHRCAGLAHLAAPGPSSVGGRTQLSGAWACPVEHIVFGGTEPCSFAHRQLDARKARFWALHSSQMCSARGSSGALGSWNEGTF